MEVPSNIKRIIDKLYSNKLVGLKELNQLDSWLNQVQYDEDVENWLAGNWDQSSDLETDISFVSIKRRIKQQNEKLKKQKIRHQLYHLQRIAAILLLPVLLVTSWLLVQKNGVSGEWFALATSPGERTHVFLPDGSEVWINVDSKLEYPSDFNKNSRSLKLMGEAYFKVAKGKTLPFIVSAKDFEVKAIGTEFNISAYENEVNATTYLEEGKVEFTYKPKRTNKVRTMEMSPGDQIVIDAEKSSLQFTDLVDNPLGNWRNGELFFDNEPMEVVFKRMERWYNIHIHFNKSSFIGETLFVNLKEGEPVERLLNIIDNAIGINVKRENDEFWISRKNDK